ncbi:MAG TPA: hypothetical protein VK158_03635 [Acidobacteriota bacterium]|nr:hypothetical protein [Acidobacteriota bacterium]
MKIIEDFCQKFNIAPKFDGTILEMNHSIVLVSKEQSLAIKKIGAVQHAGVLLGWKKKNYFKPSSQFLDMYMQEAPSVTLNVQGAWLFLCGRDVFSDSIIQADHDDAPFVVVKDQAHNILGYGQTQRGQIAIKTLYDKGDLLRREMTK